MKFLISLFALLSLAVSSPAITVSDNLFDSFGAPYSPWVRFIPRSTPTALQPKGVIMDVPVGVAPDTNGAFSVNLVGGFYDVDASGPNKPIRIYAYIGDTNTYTIGQLANFAANAAMFYTNVSSLASTGYVQTALAKFSGDLATNLPSAVVLKTSQTWQQLTNRLGLTNTAFAIAESYANKVGAAKLSSRQSLHTFLNGLASLNLVSNLADFAFFNAGMNVPRSPVSWKGTAVINGTAPNQLKGGIEFANLQGGTNSIYFTNMPPTPNGRTVIIWASQNYNQATANNVNASIVELNSAGASPNIQGAILFPDSGGAIPYWYNGSQDLAGPRIHANNTANQFFCAAVASDSTGGFLVFQRDDQRTFTGYRSSNTHPESPVVLQLGGRTPNYGAGWSGLVRGFAYFNTVLTTNQILAINALVPRVGVIIEGDSKSPADKWQPWWVQTENTWGLLSVRTNSAVSGSSVSHVDQPGASMEDRFPGDSLFTNTTQFPVNVYALRGGQNDEASDPTGGTNAWNALTNLYAQAHAVGYSVLAFTLDRCSSLTTPAYSNAWAYLNYQIRANPQLYDYIVDADQFYTTALASYQPWTNTTFYSDGIHETLAGNKLFGSNAVAAASSPGFDFEDARWTARNADTATTAATANSANTAATANTANTANTATTAGTATNAIYSQGGLGSLSVASFGALGNMIADDTAAIQACLDACAISNYACVFPSGVAGYKITSPLFVNLTNGFNIRGGFSSTAISNLCRIVQTTPDTSCFVMTNLRANQGMEVSISDLSLLGAGTNAGYGITVSNLYEALQTQTRIERVTVQNFYTGIMLTNAGTVELNRCYAVANTDGVNISGASTVVRSAGNRFHLNYRYQVILPYAINFTDQSSTYIVGANAYGFGITKALQVNFQGSQFSSGSIHPPISATNCDLTLIGCTLREIPGSTPFSIEATNVNLSIVQSFLLCDTNGLQLFEMNPSQLARNFGTRKVKELLSISGVLSTNILTSDTVSASNVLAQGTITPAALGAGPITGTNLLRDDGSWVSDLAVSSVSTPTVTANTVNAGSINVVNMLSATNDLNGFVNLRSFGAVGDFNTDDTAAIQAAFNQCSSNKVGLLVPPGNYLVQGSLSLPAINLYGNGILLDKVTCFSKTNAGAMFTNVMQHARIQGITFRGSPLNDAGVFVVSNFAFNCQLLNVTFRDCTFSRFATGVAATNSWNDTFQNCYFTKCYSGSTWTNWANNIAFIGGHLDANIYGVIVDPRPNSADLFALIGADFENNAIDALVMTNTHMLWDSSYHEGFTNYGLAAFGVQALNVNGARFTANNGTNIFLASVPSGTISGSHISNFAPAGGTNLYIAADCGTIKYQDNGNYFDGTTPLAVYDYSQIYANRPARPLLSQTDYASDVLTASGLGCTMTYNGTQWLNPEGITATTATTNYIVNAWGRIGYLSTRRSLIINANNLPSTVASSIQTWPPFIATASGAGASLAVFSMDSTYGQYLDITPGTTTTGSLIAFGVRQPAMTSGAFYSYGMAAAVDTAPSNTDTYWLYFGFSGTTTATLPVDGYGFLYDPFKINPTGMTGAATNNLVLACFKNGSGTTYTDTGMPMGVGFSGANAVRALVVGTTTNVMCFTNGVPGPASSTPITAANLYPVKLIVKTAGTTARYLQHAGEYIHVRYPSDRLYP